MKFLTNKIKSGGGNNKFKFRKTIYKQLNLLLSKPSRELPHYSITSISDNIRAFQDVKKGLPKKIILYFNREKFLKAETLVQFNEELTKILIKIHKNKIIKNIFKYFLVPIAPLTSKGILNRMGGGKGKRSTDYYKYGKNSILVVISTEKILSKNDYIKLSSMLKKLRKKYSFLTLHNIYI